MNCELPDVQDGFRKGRGTRDQISNIHWIIEKARAYQKNIYFCFIDYAKAFDCVDHNKLWKILQEMGILRQWHPTPVLLPGKSHGRRSLVGCSPWSLEESDTTEQLHFHALEKKMATHSSVLAWRIPGMGEPGGLPSMGSHRVGHD